MWNQSTFSAGRRWGPLLIAAVVVAGSLAGAATRPAGLLASFWPANALLAGLLIRWPALARWWAWPTAAVAYLAADAVTGDPPALNLILTGGNLLSAAAVVAVFRRLPAVDRRLHRPRATMQLILAGLLAGIVSATACFVPVSHWYDQAPADTWSRFLGAELSNHLVILPVVLAVTVPRRWLRRRQADGNGTSGRAGWIIATALLIAVHTFAVVVGGPGSIAFVVPPLLVAAIGLGLPATAVLSLLSTGWMLIALGHGWIEVSPSPLDWQMTISLQIGIALLAMGPIAVASAMLERDEAFVRLRRRVTRDELTGALVRSAFLDEAAGALRRCSAQRWSAAMLMLDLDHFKGINDTFGHSVGDEVLAAFGAVVRSRVRDSDLFGRLGGEEFAVLLPGIGEASATAVAERIRVTLGDQRFSRMDGAASVSTGVAYQPHPVGEVSVLLEAADRSLYRAKASGRGRVMGPPALPDDAEPWPPDGDRRGRPDQSR